MTFDFASERVRPVYSLAWREREPNGVLHAYDDGTLCGIALELLMIASKQQFRPGGEKSCLRCSAAVEAAPDVPGRHERLHDWVLGADAGEVGEELAALLRTGVPIESWGWIKPAHAIISHDAWGAAMIAADPAFAAALNNEDLIGVARVLHGGYQYAVVIPRRGPAVVSRAVV